MHFLVLFLIINCKTLFKVVNCAMNMEDHISNNFYKSSE